MDLFAALEHRGQDPLAQAGAFSLFEEAIDSQTGAIPHLHHEEDQAFYVLEGEHEFVCDGELVPAPVGTYLYVPRGIVHSYRNIG